MNVLSLWPYTLGRGVVVAVVDSGVAEHADLTGALWTNPREIAGNGKDDDHDGIIDDVHGASFAPVQPYTRLRARIDAAAWNANAQAKVGTLLDAVPSPPGRPVFPDTDGHGTHVAGIIAGGYDPAHGSAGVAPEARIMPLKVLSAEAPGLLLPHAVASAVRYAVDHGARIINLSLGGSLSMPSLDSAIAYADRHQVMVVASAGNDHLNIDESPVYPAADASFEPNVVAVAANCGGSGLADFSNYGPETVLLSAPGCLITSTAPRRSQIDDYQRAVDGKTGPREPFLTLSGTSMAAAMVSGLAALLWSLAPQATVAQIERALCPGNDEQTGLTVCGAADATASLHALEAEGLYAPPGSLGR
jgi:subtilisin family serine protease